MSDIIFPLSPDNVAQVVAEKDAEIERLRTLVKVIEDYNALLIESENSMLGLAIVHGYRCPDDIIKRGEELRAAIRALKEK